MPGVLGKQGEGGNPVSCNYVTVYQVLVREVTTYARPIAVASLLTGQLTKTYVARPGLEPGAQGYEPSMFPLHHPAKTGAGVGLEPTTIALRFEGYPHALPAEIPRPCVRMERFELPTPWPQTKSHSRLRTSSVSYRRITGPVPCSSFEVATSIAKPPRTCQGGFTN